MSTSSLDIDDYYVNVSLQGLQTSNVYVSPEAKGVNLDQIRQDVGTNNIAVVVLPNAAGSGDDASLYASTLAQWTNYDTVVVVLGDNVEAVSHVVPVAELDKVVDNAELNTTSINAAVAKAIDGIEQAELSTSTSQSSNPSDDGGTSIVGVSSIGLTVALVAGVAGWWFHRRKRQKAQAAAPTTVEPVFDPLASVRERIAILRGQSHRLKDSSMQATLAQALSDIDKILGRTNDDRFIAEIESMLSRVIEVVEEYLYFQDNPREFKDNQVELLKQGTRAVDTFAEEALKALQTGNSDRLIKFLTATELLDKGKLTT